MAARNRVEDKDLGWNAMMRAVQELAEGAYVKVGVLADDEKGGLHVPGASLTVAEEAAVNEFGTEDGRIPARPAHRLALDAHQDELTQLGADLLLKATAERTITIPQALGIMGATQQANVRNFITQGSEVPPHNAASTARRKMAAGKWNAKGKAQREAGWGIRTLVDTGRTVGAITYVVVLGKGK